MFDKLIVSEPERAEFKNRRGYFLVSSLAVGVLFITAVVISIFAADFGLGTRNFDLVEMIAPAEMAVAPEPQKQQPRTATQSRSHSPLPTRQVNMARVDEPTIVPNTISTAQNTQMARPDTGRFEIGPLNTDPVGGDPIDTERGGPTHGPSGLGTGDPIVIKEPEPDPPPVVKKDPVVKPTVSGGVMNGKAISLPKPAYSAAAKAIGAHGQVTVQVLIDENGNVVSASATGGNALLRPAAVQAARNAKFSPTYLSGVKVKVTGVIVYNFIR